MNRFDAYISSYTDECEESIKKILSPISVKEKIIASKIVERLLPAINTNITNCGKGYIQRACTVLFDYCEIVNDWFYWRQWAELLPEDFLNPMIYAGLGRASEENDALEKSSEYHIKGLSNYSTKISDKWTGMNFLGLGIVQSRLLNNDSIKNLEQAKKIFNKLRLPYYKGFTHSNLGGLYYRKLVNILDAPLKKNLYKRFTFFIKSLWHHLISIFIHLKINLKLDLPVFIYSLGWTFYHGLTTLFLCKLAFIVGKKIARDIGQQRYEALCWYGLGWYFFKRKKYNIAILRANEAFLLYSKYHASFERKYTKTENYYKENIYNIRYLICMSYYMLEDFDKFEMRFNELFEILVSDHLNGISLPKELINGMYKLAFKTHDCEKLAKLCQLQNT